MTTRSGRCVLVTGASSGIGRATARRFAELGDRVFGTSRHPRPGETGSAADYPGISMVQLDVRDPDSVRRCVETVLARSAGIDIVINNAGRMQVGVAEETKIIDAHDIFETNLFGVARVVDAVLPAMRARRRGRIINVGSLAAWLGEPGEAFYAGSKGALARYGESLRQEVRTFGIQVSLIEPGVFATAVIDNAAISSAGINDYTQIREAIQRTLHRAMGTGADPDRVARLITRVAASRRPRYRYAVGGGAVWLPPARVLLPQSLLDALIRRGYHLP